MLIGCRYMTIYGMTITGLFMRENPTDNRVEMRGLGKIT